MTMRCSIKVKFLLAGLWTAWALAAGNAPAVDLSSPDACFATFMKAFEAGDEARAAAACQGDRGQQEWLRAEVRRWRDLRDLESALSTRFGAGWKDTEAGQAIVDRIGQLGDDDLHGDLKRADHVLLDGGGLLLVVNDGDADELQPRITQVAGRWRLDLESLSQYMSPGDAPVLRAIAKAAVELSKRVAAREFSSLDAAAEAIAEKLSAARDSALAAPQGTSAAERRSTR